ncbi:MAG: hypothetical protein IPO21_17760 [Bacteroidales bacterium]|nr:hypothetical protein [Bacteroidales bacterium]
MISKEPIYKIDTTTYNYNTYNHLTYFNIPIILSYTFAIGKKIEIEPATGIELNLLIHSNGLSLSNSYDLVPLKQIYKSLFVSSITELRLRYAITDNHKLSLNAGASISLGNTTHTEHFAQKKSSRLFFGLSYQYCFK